MFFANILLYLSVRGSSALIRAIVKSKLLGLAICEAFVVSVTKLEGQLVLENESMSLGVCYCCTNNVEFAVCAIE